VTLAALIRKRESAKPANANPAKAANDERGEGEPLAGLAALALANPTEAKTANAATSWCWLLHFTDREPMEVYFNPDASFDRVMTAYPGAQAEPIPERFKQVFTQAEDDEWAALWADADNVATTCTTCSISRKPGASRYCCARPELPPAYGEGHPLRKLPDDDGADCEQWVSRVGGT